MDLNEVVRTRRSIRSYMNDPIPNEILNRILEAVRVAPSESNRQPWHWILVKDEEKKQSLAKICNSQMWIAEAPLVILARALARRKKTLVSFIHLFGLAIS